MDLKSTYNLIAEDWAKDHENDTWWIEGTKKFIKLLSPNVAVLDVGCGSGYKAKFLLGNGLKVTGIDFSEKMIDLARRKGGGEFHVLDARDILKLNKTFDGIFAQAVLLHFPKKETPTLLQNFQKALNRMGYLYIAVKESRIDKPEEEILTESDYGYSYSRFFSYYTQAELEEYFKNLGMKIIYEDVAKLKHTNWIQIVAQNV